MDQTASEFTKLNEQTKGERDALNAKRTAVNQEMDAFREKLRPDREAIQNRQVEAINAILRPDQVQLFANFRAEREKQRKLMHERDQQQHNHKKQ